MLAPPTNARSLACLAAAPLALGLAVCAPSPAASDAARAPAPPDTLDPGRLSDGGAVRMNASLRERLVAEDPLWAEALALHYDALVMDGHIDVPSLIVDEAYDIGARHTPLVDRHHVDLPKMFEGGLDAAFFSVYVARTFGEGGEATDRALLQIAELKRQVEANAERIGMAYSVADVLRLAGENKKAALMGLEGGHALQSSSDVLRQLHEAGIRYVTLTHTNTNGWADSSQDRPRWGGLNGTGEALVREMNRLGVLVDLSHVADSTFWDAVRVSRAPVIASHSSARALVNSVRNLSDEQLRAVGQTGGVVMVNFYDRVVNRHLTPEVMGAVYERIEREHGGDLAALFPAIAAETAARGLPGATWEDVVEHVAHVARVAGVDHVGLGSDFDGVSKLPDGMGDVTRLPYVTYGLLKRGFSSSDVRKILGGNTLRALRDAERVAAEVQAEEATR